MVFSVTVLPPVFGPVITSSRRSPSSSIEIGTTLPPLIFRLRSSSGCRALCRISRAPHGLRVGSPPHGCPRCARAGYKLTGTQK